MSNDAVVSVQRGQTVTKPHTSKKQAHLCPCLSTDGVDGGGIVVRLGAVAGRGCGSTLLRQAQGSHSNIAGQHLQVAGRVRMCDGR